MKNIVKAVLLLVFLGFIPVSCSLFCDSSSCGCGELKPVKNYTITNLGIQDINLVTTQPIDTTIYQPSDNYVKALSVTETKLVGRVKYLPGFRFVNTAYGCDPIGPEAVQAIASIKIIARENVFYNSLIGQIATGNIINNIFLLKADFEAQFRAFPNFAQSPLFINNYNNYYLKVKAAPANPVKLNFDILITMTDSSKYAFPNQQMKIAN